MTKNIHKDIINSVGFTFSIEQDNKTSDTNVWCSNVMDALTPLVNVVLKYIFPFETCSH